MHEIQMDDYVSEPKVNPGKEPVNWSMIDVMLDLSESSLARIKTAVTMAEDEIEDLRKWLDQLRTLVKDKQP